MEISVIVASDVQGTCSLLKTFYEFSGLSDESVRFPDIKCLTGTMYMKEKYVYIGIEEKGDIQKIYKMDLSHRSHQKLIIVNKLVKITE
jgi:hypothetical protein